MAYEHNFFISQGSDWSANVIVYTSNTTGRFVMDTSELIPTTNQTYDPTIGRFTRKVRVGAGMLRKCMSANATANIVATIPIDATANGLVTLTMNSMVTSSIPYGRYLYDVEFFSRDDIWMIRAAPEPPGWEPDYRETAKVLPIVRGTITIQPSVTRIVDWGSSSVSS